MIENNLTVVNNKLPRREIESSNTTNNNIVFTDDQQKAYIGIINFINAPFNDSKFIISLTGAGGVGKTFLIKYIITSPKCKIVPSAMKVSSSTHKACRVFSQALGGMKVDTIQSTLGLRLDLKLEDFDPDNPQFAPGGKTKLDNIRLLIIDEVSMLPAKLVTFIRDICLEKQIKVLAIGDDFQLFPVKQNKSIMFNIAVENYKLTQIVRQDSKNPILNLLNMLRNDISKNTNSFIDYISKHRGEMIYNDNEEGYSIVGPQGFKNFVDICFAEDVYKSDIQTYKVVCYTNNKIALWNKYIRNRIIENSEKNIINRNDLIMSYETIVNEFNEIIINNSEEYIVHDIIDYIDQKYYIKGYQVRFQMVYGGQITKPLFIVDHKDLDSISKWVKVADELKKRALTATRGNRVERWKDYYNFRKEYLISCNIIDNNDISKFKYTRDLDYAFTLTAHKSQGSTYNTVLVDMNDMIYDKYGYIRNDREDMLRRLYVACSRASKNLIIGFGNMG